MNQKIEVQEAVEAAQKVLLKIDEIIASLQNTKSWSWFDILGGDLIASVVKRNKISKINILLKELEIKMKCLEKELSDINVILPKSISNTDWDYAFDIFFDNIFTDLRVKNELDELEHELLNCRSLILDIKKNCEENIRETSNERMNLKD